MKAPAGSATAAAVRRLLLLHPTARPIRCGTFAQERWNWLVRAAVVIVFGWARYRRATVFRGHWSRLHTRLRWRLRTL